jgi:urocanate hydratase
VVSTAVLGATDVPDELLRRRVEIDIVTDQTSTKDPLAHRRMGVSAQDRPLAQGSQQ